MQSRGFAGVSRWQEWIIVVSILALAGIGVASIWGGSIRRWIDSSSDERPGPARTDSIGPSGARL